MVALCEDFISGGHIHIRAWIRTLSNALIELKYFFGGVWIDGKTTLRRYIMVETYVLNMAADIKNTMAHV